MYTTLKKKEPIYQRIIFIYTLIYAVYALFGRVTWLYALVGNTFNRYMYIFFALFGFSLLWIDFLIYHNYKKVKYYPLFFIFIGVALISSVLNANYGISDNAKTIIWLLIQMILFTTMGYLFTKQQYRNWLTIFFSASGWIWAFAALVSLYQYIFVKGYLITLNMTMYERPLRQSFYGNRLFGIFADPNMGAFVSLLVIWGMIYLYRTHKHTWIRVLCIINCAIQVAYIILSGSRSVEVCLVVSLSYTIIYFLLQLYRKKSFRLPIRIASYLLVPVLVFVLLFVSFNCFRIGAARLANWIAPEIHQGEDELIRQDTGDDNPTNNRIKIWKAYLNLMKDKPLFGISPRNRLTYAEKEYPGSYLAIRHYYSTHNMFIAVLACTGMIGFAVLLILIFYLGKTILPRSVDIQNMNLHYFIALQIILNIFIFIFFYSGIYFTNGIDTILFWPAIGFALKDIESV